jgi:DNA-binding XRE family transcriptional regulator
MDQREFSFFRQKLGKTQKQIAQLLGTSLKAVHSYEQGWRQVPAHVERQLFFLLSRKVKDARSVGACWKVNNCPDKRKKECPAWEFKTGDCCWFVNGTICEGTVHKTWQQKMDVCRACQVFTNLLAAIYAPSE